MSGPAQMAEFDAPLFRDIIQNEVLPQVYDVRVQQMPAAVRHAEFIVRNTPWLARIGGIAVNAARGHPMRRLFQEATDQIIRNYIEPIAARTRAQGTRDAQRRATRRWRSRPWRRRTRR